MMQKIKNLSEIKEPEKIVVKENQNLIKPPREENFIEMITTSVCPLLKVKIIHIKIEYKKFKSFTFFICIFDCLFYALILFVQVLIK
jgi:hypothetical protein